MSRSKTWVYFSNSVKLLMEAPRWARKEFNSARLRLEGNVCSHCNGRVFPPRVICPYCGGEVHDSSLPQSSQPEASQIVYTSAPRTEVAINKQV